MMIILYNMFTVWDGGIPPPLVPHGYVGADYIGISSVFAVMK